MIRKTFARVPILIFALSLVHTAQSQSLVSFQPGTQRFPLVHNGQAAQILASPQDLHGIQKVIGLFQNDIERVSGVKPNVLFDTPKSGTVVIVGTLGHHPQLDALVKRKKVNVTPIAGKWEHYLIQVVKKPFPGVSQALVIAGSDKRGTLFGMFELSAQMGVSPWYWWADVPVEKHTSIYIKPGPHADGPAVRYRGIFINDEAPALSGWVHEKFGKFNAAFYEHVFELILRLKGNFLWPACGAARSTTTIRSVRRLPMSTVL